MATLTINIPNSQVNRVREAFAYALNLGSPSSQTVTLQTVEDYVVRDLKQFVRTAEQQKAYALATVGSPQEVSFSNSG